jgi:hypothetical protein
MCPHALMQIRLGLRPYIGTQTVLTVEKLDGECDYGMEMPMNGKTDASFVTIRIHISTRFDMNESRERVSVSIEITAYGSASSTR